MIITKEFLESCIAAGETSRQIANKCGKSFSTVRRKAKALGVKWLKSRDIPKNEHLKLNKKFGKLTIKRFSHYQVRPSRGRQAYWVCKCDCGTENVLATFGNLNNGNVSSCGCLHDARLSRLHKSNIKPDAPFKAVFNCYKQSAKRGGREFTLTEHQFRKITQQNCQYCGCEPSFRKDRNGKHKYLGKPYIYNGIDRINNQQGYVLENCAPCCRICNIAKACMTVQEFLDLCRKVVDHAARKRIV